MRVPRLFSEKRLRQGLILAVFASWVFAPQAVADPHRLRLPSAAPEVRLPKEKEPPPAYPLSYADQVASRLGINDGKMDVFEVAPERNNDFVPALKGGIDGKGANIKLQWRFGD